MTVSLQPVLTAPSPSAWLDEHLHARFTSSAGDGRRESLATYTLDEVLADDADLLRTIHARLVAGGTPPPAAATYLADWFGGIVAVAVGFGLAAAGAGFVCDRENRGEAIRFHVHPNGWPCRVELRARALVTSDHHWATDRVPGHETVDSVEQAIHRTVHELVDTVAPIVVACRSLASVGTVGLWNEVADSLGAALVHQDLVDPTPEMAEVLRTALTTPGVPWRSRPSLRFVESDLLGTVHLIQKGGCCLAYTTVRDRAAVVDAEVDPSRAAFARRFPNTTDAPRYCATCSFRDADDCNQRQVYWRELQHRR